MQKKLTPAQEESWLIREFGKLHLDETDDGRKTCSSIAVTLKHDKGSTHIIGVGATRDECIHDYFTQVLAARHTDRFEFVPTRALKNGSYGLEAHYNG